MTLVAKLLVGACAALLLLIASCAHAIDWDECTHDGKYAKSTCYGIEHGVYAAIGVGVFTAIDARMAPIAAAGACGIAMLREGNGPGSMFENADRVFDWVVPCAVGLAIAWKWGDNSWLPWVGDGGAGLQYQTRFD